MHSTDYHLTEIFKGERLMALLTKKAIMSTFEQMLEEMPFDKITVSALVKRCGVSSNTFYYHYQDIYELLNVWFTEVLGAVQKGNTDLDWKENTKSILTACKAHPKIIYHIFDSLSREQLEHYVFSSTNDSFTRQVRVKASGHNIPDERMEEIASFCRYAFFGYFIKFLWDNMDGDPEESVDRLGVLFEQFVTSSIAQYEKS